MSETHGLPPRTGHDIIRRHRFDLREDGNTAEIDSNGLAEEIDEALSRLNHECAAERERREAVEAERDAAVERYALAIAEAARLRGRVENQSEIIARYRTDDVYTRAARSEARALTAEARALTALHPPRPEAE